MPNAMISMNPRLNTGDNGDFGRTLMQIEAIKGQRMQNQLLQRAMERKSTDAIDYESKLLDYGIKSARVTGFNEYPQYRQNMIRLGMKADVLPEKFENEEAYNKWRDTAILTAEERMAVNKLRTEAQTFPMSKVLDDGRVAKVTVKSLDEYNQYKQEGYQRGEITGKPDKEASTELTKMMNERDALPAGDPRRKTLDAAIAKKTASTGMKVYDPDGNLIVDTGGGGGEVPKGARTELFKDVVQHQQEIDSIRNIRNIYEPDFLTYKGSAKGEWATFMNKLDPQKRSQFQQRRSAFLSAANQAFIAYRKWATGVAGGEKEMAEIKRATFSEDDSPQDFEAKLQLAESTARRLNARIKAALKAGVDNQKAFQKFIEANPLEGMPTVQQRGDQLEKMGYSPDKVMAILVDEGYMQAGGTK